MATCALRALDDAGRERLFGLLGEGVAQTLRRLLKALEETGGPTKPRVSADKVRQEWERAWDEWWEHVHESGDEHGDYIVQEHHWEEPHLAASGLASDLEPIAARMRPLLTRVAEEGLDPDFSFASVLRETVEETGAGLPDWFPDWRDHEGCEFGPEVTGCLLEWEWAQTRREGGDAFPFLHALCALEQTKGLTWDWPTVERFVETLPEAEQRAVVEGIRQARGADPWKSALGSAYSGWFRLHQTLSRRWDRVSYTEAARAGVDQDWTLALPLLDDLLREKKFQEAALLAEEAAGVLLRVKEAESWDAREVLWAQRVGPHWDERPDAEVRRLLGLWEKAARGLGDAALAEALRLQTALCRGWQDGDTALRAFERVPQRHAGVRDRLFAAWRDHVVDKSLRARWGEESPRPAKPGWVGPLVDAARAGESGEEFRSALARWMREAGATRKSFDRERRALALLTFDLDAATQGRVPSELRAVLRSGEQPKALAASRARWLKRMGADALLPELLEIWKRHAEALLLDPALVHDGRYDDHVRSLAAVHALDSELYWKVVHKWARAHERRRNLWTAIDKRGLPSPRPPSTPPS
ncbi:MAG: hypothetical protein WDA71_05305 [Actinomycetota bacterium]